MLSGILLVDKPSGPTSHGVVAQARKTLGLKKIGHAGTLDPMASGLLTLGVGPGTKLLTFLVGQDKTYTATIRLGVSTHTDDAEGETTAAADETALSRLSEALIEEALMGFQGTISQIPSSVSAVRVEGKKAYERVREGEEVNLAPREVTIHRIVVHDIRRQGPLWDVDIEVECSSGTYIRAIARDLGTVLGVGGHLTALRRTAVGPFRVEDALPTDSMNSSNLLSLSSVARRVMAHRVVSPDQAVELGHGKKVFMEHPQGPGSDSPVACIDPNDRLVAIVRVDEGVSRILVGFPREESASE